MRIDGRVNRKDRPWSDAQVYTVDHRTTHESPGFSDLWQQKRILAYDLEGGFRHVDVAILRLNSAPTLR